MKTTGETFGATTRAANIRAAGGIASPAGRPGASTDAPSWPTCGNCRDWSRASCRYAPRSAHRWQHPAAGGTPGAVCGYWHSPEGETRRQRCRVVNNAFQKTRPPIARRETGRKS